MNLKSYEAKVKKMDGKAQATERKVVRQEFIDNLGLPKAGDNKGYKFQKVADPALLEKVVEAKMKFEVLVEVTGKGRDILGKMTRNLANADRASVFAQIEREAKKKASAEATETTEESVAV